VTDVTDLAVACSLSDRERVERRAGLFADLRRWQQEVRWLPDGVTWRYPASSEVLTLLTEFIGAESQCCPFLRFRLTLEPGGGPLWLELTGPPGTREFLAAEVEPPLAPGTGSP
jgi:hypothetical protein